MLMAAPALADVKSGVDAWQRGDFRAAVSAWRDPAAAGDADAQFNLAQAYRLGRGVEADPREAERYYRLAARQGHLKAADNYGLILFQDGRRSEALPYVQKAAQRGDPRAQYLLGIAHFNGDMVAKDWVRAYALLTNANAAGLPQAAPAIAQMDDFIPLDQRQQAQTLAGEMRKEADAMRASQMAAVDLGTPGGAGSVAASTGIAPAASPAPVRTARATVEAPRASPAAPPQPRRMARASDIPQPIPSTPVPPSVVAAQRAVAEAARVTGTGSPATAGADFARPGATSGTPTVRSSSPEPAPSSAPTPRRPAVASTPASAPAALAPQSATLAQPTADGPWRVQLGAFGVKGNAERLWQKVSRMDAFSGKRSFMVPAGRLTKLQAGGFASRSAAQTACNAAKRRGTDCIVTR